MVNFQQLLEAFYLALQKSKADLRPYNAIPLQYNSSVQVDLFKPCNGWTVINQGSNPVIVNGTLTLAQFEFISVGGNEGEEYKGFLRLQFATNGDPNNNVIVYQKFYVDGASRFDKPFL